MSMNQLRPILVEESIGGVSVHDIVAMARTFASQRLIRCSESELAEWRTDFASSLVFSDVVSRVSDYFCLAECAVAAALIAAGGRLSTVEVPAPIEQKSKAVVNVSELTQASERAAILARDLRNRVRLRIGFSPI